MNQNPRLSDEGESLVGKVCICSLGRVGVVYGGGPIVFPSGGGGDFWHGFGLDGRGLWATARREGRPVVVIAESLAEYADKVKARPSSVLYASPAVAVK
jgi:hypothetical protein